MGGRMVVVFDIFCVVVGEIGEKSPIKWPNFHYFLSEDWRRACSIPRHPWSFSQSRYETHTKIRGKED